ncbi:site-2 protease family protein [Patescibacteria group bacterium]|nr:site-2 protease family protein [Patescibacteria group bacterium]MBU0777126.1 site-2 protease family protein [Patescibacteria group bacterium]MBU0845820.1 site-2 protease family protein [Patescibacteria group bacterium]MBU0922847.1 site-2 protease family protein [Patescibacteria group bacterium]MBU1066420.1 site-2 protease family protein [Patescibacteria group bacterium]
MSVFVSICQLILVVVIHEWGHAYAASRLGFSYDTIFIGLPVQPKKIFDYGRKKVIVSPWLIGGGVNISEKGLLKASFPKKILVYGAGPVFNIATGFITAYLIFGKKGLMITWGFLDASFQATVMLLTGQIGLEQLSSPIGIVSIASKAIEADFLLGAVFIWLLLNFGVAMANLAPVPALDGGQIWMGAICSLFGNKPGIVKIVKYLTSVFLVLLVGGMLFLTARDIAQLMW